MEEGGNAIVMKNLKEQGWSLWNCALDKKWVEWCDRCREAAEIEYDYLDEDPDISNQRFCCISFVEPENDIIEGRVNVYGISEPLVQTNYNGNDYRIIVELAGVKDVNEAIKMIGETPLLELPTWSMSL